MPTDQRIKRQRGAVSQIATLFMGKNPMPTDQSMHIIFALLASHIIFALPASQLRERNVHHLNEEVCNTRQFVISPEKSRVTGSDQRGMLQLITGLTGVIFGEAQRWCYPKNVPVETTLPNQHSHIC
jgi:hypothetical protein